MIKGQTYTDEFKELIVGIILDNKKSIIELSEELGLCERTLYKWSYAQRNYRKVSENRQFKNLTDEIDKLKKDILQIKKERDVLKKIIKTQLF